jgi:hypothetical protein
MFGKKIVISDPLLYCRRIERWENFRVTQVYTLKCQRGFTTIVYILVTN